MPSRNIFQPLILVAICVPFLLPTLSVAQEPVLMTKEKMGEQLREKFGDDRVEGQDGVWKIVLTEDDEEEEPCLLYTSPSPRDQRGSRMPSSA